MKMMPVDQKVLEKLFEDWKKEISEKSKNKIFIDKEKEKKEESNQKYTQ